ncbi:tRNA 5-methoxyuridine(34)/uridine 5-oxyacetic acid(34) synthase CmoB [Helicobacter sp. MIT 99-5507]|uniref:tRNA 5-methoxyuridine(34)/uridine 5-oxyacetic acid(34) synthase CmoB n=1 Tax=Helicobacter sp. MIT 99-5507 TaxID=152489 RepID=UPI0038D18812
MHKNRITIKQKLEAKNIASLRHKIASMPKDKYNITIDDIIKIESSDIEYKEDIINLAYELKPWRKGPFQIFDNLINSEWNSSIKYNIIKNHLNINNKIVADIGCNNGYYMFRMLELNPKKIIGFDPSAHCFCQFDFINHFIDSKIKFEMLGIQDLTHYDIKFDTILCLGVLYHRTNPIDCLKILKQALNLNGELILDCLIIDSIKPIALSPLSYAKMKNVYFIPSISALRNWLERANFKDIEIIATKKTNLNEQRKTEWINGESLESFLDKNNPAKTIEGYQAPKRIYLKAKG